jgi:hypothetical protein
MAIRTALPFLLALVLFLAGATSAAAAPASRVAGFATTIHGAAQLELTSCIHPDNDGGALFLAYIDNASAAHTPGFTVTLHNERGELLAERTFPALQPGDSKTFAVRLSAAQARSITQSGSALCS